MGIIPLCTEMVIRKTINVCKTSGNCCLLYLGPFCVVGRCPIVNQEIVCLFSLLWNGVVVFNF